MPGIRHCKPRETDGKADRGEKIRLRSIAIEAEEGLKNYRVGTWAIAAPLFDFFAPDLLHRSFTVLRCVLIGCTDVVLCCDVDLLIACIGSEGPFVV
jgi:hypothetical protein